MFGYACNDNEAYMPAPIYYSHEILKELKKVDSSVKVIILTSLDNLLIDDVAKEAGSVAVIKKPATKESLKEMITKFL